MKHRSHHLLLVLLSAILFSGCWGGSGSGLALVEDVAGDDNVVAGSLQIADGCVTLSERGHRVLTLGWPVAATTWDSATQSVGFEGSVERTLHHGDRVTLTGQLVDDPDQVAWTQPPDRACRGEAVMLVADVTEIVEASTPVDEEVVAPERPIGGGRAGGTGSAQPLECPSGVEAAEEEWFGPAGLTLQGAVAEAFGDLVVGWIGEPFELESTDEWSSWGLRDNAGRLVAVVTVVTSNGGWDPSHARYCVIPRPTPPPAPFTLYVSNQSFEDATVRITVAIDGEVVIDQDFAVEGQHNWIEFTPALEPGEHTLTATSNTGAELTIDLALPENEPRWAVLDYWYSPEEGPRRFTFNMSDQPLAFD